MLEDLRDPGSAGARRFPLWFPLAGPRLCADAGREGTGASGGQEVLGQTGERSGPVTSWSEQQWETEAGSQEQKAWLVHPEEAVPVRVGGQGERNEPARGSGKEQASLGWCRGLQP